MLAQINASQKYLGLFDVEKNEERFPLDTPTDIFKFEERLLAALSNYGPKVA